MGISRGAKAGVWTSRILVDKRYTREQQTSLQAGYGAGSHWCGTREDGISVVRQTFL